MHHITWFGQTVKIPRENVQQMLQLVASLKVAGIKYHHVFVD